MKFFDRDISWLSFNSRVLMEAADANVPLFERIKFLAIYSSNLDEFFRVRVASIRSIAEIDKKKINKKFEKPPKELLEDILTEVNKQQTEFGRIKRDEIIPALKAEGVCLYRDEPFANFHDSWAKDYYKNQVHQSLEVVDLMQTTDLPHLENKALYLVAHLKKADSTHIGLIKLPSGLPRFVEMPKNNDLYYFAAIDDIIRHNISELFAGFEIKGIYSIKLNRDADLQIEDEYSGDLVKKIEKQIKKRDLGTPSRFLYDGTMPQTLLAELMQRFDIEEQDLVEGGRYHNMNDLFQLPNPHSPRLENETLPALPIDELDQADNLWEVVNRKDVLMHFPFESYDYVLRFFDEAAHDPFVTEIKATFYRIAADSAISKSLIRAANNGKSVMVFVEVKARFDEANNLLWAEKMEEAGIRIIYSIPGLKVHAKVALVVRSKNGHVKKYAYFGTGNFNEKTARIYADEALLTSQAYLTNELGDLFSYLNNQQLEIRFDRLLVAQFNIRQQFRSYIDREIAHARKGEKAHIIIKLNNLEDEKMINKLYEASEAGVKIQLIVRAICRLIPGVEGMSSNITIHRIVDRFLEHSRVFYFYNNGAEDMFMGSADWMRRNLYHRIEVVFPIYDPSLKKEMLTLLDFQLRDAMKGKMINSKLENVDVEMGSPELRAQHEFYNYLKSRPRLEENHGRQK